MGLSNRHLKKKRTLLRTWLRTENHINNQTKILELKNVITKVSMCREARVGLTMEWIVVLLVSDASGKEHACRCRRLMRHRFNP